MTADEVRLGDDGHPAWQPGDDLEAAIDALEAYTIEAIRLELVALESKAALLAYTAEHEGVIDWMAYNEAVDAWTAEQRASAIR
jgi:hypothetical protein